MFIMDFLLALFLVISVLAKRLAGKSVSDMTYIVSSGMLNLNSINLAASGFTSLPVGYIGGLWCGKCRGFAGPLVTRQNMKGKACCLLYVLRNVFYCDVSGIYEWNMTTEF